MAAGIEEEQKVLDVEEQRQQKQMLTQNSSHPRACLALPHVPAAECLFLAPLLPAHARWWRSILTSGCAKNSPSRAWLNFPHDLLLP